MVRVVQRAGTQTRQSSKGKQKGGKGTARLPRDLIRLVGKIHAVLVALVAAACYSTAGTAPGIPVVSTFEHFHGIVLRLRTAS